MVEEGLPDGLLDQKVDLVIANMPYVTDSTIFDRSPEIRREPRIAVTGDASIGDCGEDGLGVIRGVLAEIPSGWRVAFEHDTHHGPTMREMLGDGEHPDRLHGRRAGDCRPRALSDEADQQRGPAAGSTEAERRAKADRLREEGIDPFPRSFAGRNRIAEIHAAHDPEALGEGEHSEFTYRVAGRVTGQRGHGKTVFFDVRDLSGTIQAYAQVDALGAGGLRPDRGPRHRRHRRRRRRALRDQTRAAGDRGAGGDPAGQGAARPARPLPRDLRPRHPLPPARARPDGQRRARARSSCCGRRCWRRSAST